MSRSRPKPTWQLPPGVSRGSLDYIESPQIADGYDDDLGLGFEQQFDEEVLLQAIPEKGLVADLGCGTARALIPLVRRGNQGLAVDLSSEMLRIVQQKATEEDLTIECLQANLVELDTISSGSIDHAICMFSTLGMIRGSDNRKTFLDHCFRILKPGATFVVHVHNFWANLYGPNGLIWIVNHFFQCWTSNEIKPGDKYYPYRGIPNFYLHVYWQSEFESELKNSQFQVRRMIPLRTDRQGQLAWPRLLSSLRAGGWIAICEKPK